MPPQGYVVLGGLGWNIAAAALGKPTISMFCRRHKTVAVAVSIGITAWWFPHLLRTAVAVAEELADTRPEIAATDD